LEEVTIEKDNLASEKDNLQELVDFYEESGKNEKSDNKDNEKIKDFEEKIIIKDNEIEVLKKRFD